jgi:penicillin-binding protein 1A
MSVLVSVCALLMAALLAVGWVVAVADSAPDLKQLKPHPLHPLSQVFAANGASLGYIHSESVFQSVNSNQIPQTLKQATVAIEDRRFYQHGALDYQGILRAGIKDLFGGGGLQGASTLTMQLVNNKYLDWTKYANRHDLKYKIIQAKLAEEEQKGHSKDWILTSYLNVVPYGTVDGESAYGVGAAAEMFFDKPVWKLSLAQQALLAGLPQAPTDYNPFVHPARSRTRRNAVLQAMVQTHSITQEQASAAESQRLGVQHNTSYTVRRQPYVFDYVEKQLDAKFCPRTPTYCPIVSNGGLKVYTTLDLTRQQEATQAVVSHEGGAVLNNQPAAALVSIDPTNGHIVAMANSSTYGQTNYNFAAQAQRQPGSAFKVFALMTLIHDYNGDPNQTYYTSRPLTAGWLSSNPSWSVHTAEDTYQGRINITKATIMSDNTVFAQLVVDLGPDKMDAIAHQMGITSQLDGLPAEVIGGLTRGVTPLEMSDAYATLANGGTHIAPTIVSKVVFPDGSTMNMGDPPHQTVFSSGETYAATKVLQGVIQSGTGTAANYGCPAAGKTGTAENYDNAWFVGYTPQLSTAVWVGYPQSNNISMPNGFGGTLAAPIWHDYMAQASNGFCGDFPQPTTYWSGTAFTGQYSNVAPAPSTPSGANAGNPYNNPKLYAQPPQPTTGAGGGVAPTPPSPGKPGGQGTGNGNGNGNGNGGGAPKKH